MKILKISALLLGFLGGMASAQSGSPLVESIRRSGSITLGHGDETVPFTYIIKGENVPRGFSHDIELAIVEHLKKKLSMPELKVNYQLLTYANVLSMVQSGKVHLHCGTTVNTIERQKDLNFSTAFFVGVSRLLVNKNSGITGFKALKGKNVAAMDNTPQLDFIRSRRSQFGIKTVKPYELETEIAKALDSGEMDAFFMSDAIVAGVVARLAHPEEWITVGKGAGAERFGCIMSKSDANFKNWVDEALLQLYASGEIYKLYDKWFKEPVVPFNKAIGFEMSKDVKQIYELPTDKAIGQP